MSNQEELPQERKRQVKKKKTKQRSTGARVILRILRFCLVPFLCLVALGVGMMVGYVYIGKQDVSEVWNIATWKHVYDLVFTD